MRDEKRGTTLDCWRHYSATLPQGTRNCNDAREGLREFLGVSVGTVRRYITKPESLKGLPLVKMRYFLSAMGYVVAELEAMQDYARDLAEMIALDVIAIDFAYEVLGYKNVHGVFRLIHGKSLDIEHDPNGRKRIERIRVLCQQKKEEVARLRHLWNGRWNIPVADTKVPNQAVGLINDGPSFAQKRSAREARDNDMVIFAGLVRALLPIANRLASDDYSAEDRREARAQAGPNNVFSLSNALNQLCSETAREQLSKEGQTPSPHQQPARSKE